MAGKFDVAARLAEGNASAQNIQSYVWACHVLGYQQPDLTLHAAQVRDWYGSEDGLDLHVLDRDCASLQAAAAACEDVVRRQCDALTAVNGAWEGGGAEAATEFLRRHCDAAGSVVDAVRGAADTCAALRDNLWQMVDGKVAAATAIDDRRQAQRAAWLGAAQAVTGGAADATAADVIDQQVKPFVDNDIRTDWLTVMRSTLSSVAESYDAATAGLAATIPGRFDVPGDLGPREPPSPSPVERVPEPTIAARAATVPAAAFAPPAEVAWPAAAPTEVSPIPPPPGPIPAASAPLPTGPETIPPAAGLPTGGSLGSGGLPDLAGGIGGLAGQIADALGSVLGAPADALSGQPPPGGALDGLPDIGGQSADHPVPDTTDPTDDVSRDDQNADDTAPDDGAPPDPGRDDCGPPPVEPPVTAEATGVEAKPQQPQSDPAPVATPPAPATPPVPDPRPAAAGATPCEIAADELPQVGP